MYFFMLLLNIDKFIILLYIFINLEQTKFTIVFFFFFTKLDFNLLKKVVQNK